MKDLLNNEVAINDEVFYVFQNKQGRIVHQKCKVVGFTKNGAKVQTPTNIINVKNIVKINENVSLFDKIKKFMKSW